MNKLIARFLFVLIPAFCLGFMFSIISPFVGIVVFIAWLLLGLDVTKDAY